MEHGPTLGDLMAGGRLVRERQLFWAGHVPPSLLATRERASKTWLFQAWVGVIAHPTVLNKDQLTRPFCATDPTVWFAPANPCGALCSLPSLRARYF